VFSDYIDDFADIRPYTDAEMGPVLKRLTRNDWLISGMRRLLFPGWPKFLKPFVDKLVKFSLWLKLRGIKTIDQFQHKIIINKVMEYIVKKTIGSVTTTGVEDLDPDTPYLYISTHRDIVMDSAMVNYVMATKGKRIAEIAFGDNLLINDFVSDLIRINRSFIVRRQTSNRERAKGAVTLSRYINYTMEQRHSVWLAQREGRAKDGDDRTNPAVLKMLHLGPRREGVKFNDFVGGINIVPVAISYEFDPCDVLKARELHRTKKAGEYRKRKGEDLLSMYAGLSGWKGRVHLSFGKPMRGEFSGANELANEIDKRIHHDYHLFPSNYIAHDELSGENSRGMYTNEEKVHFMQRFRRESSEVTEYALKIYSNVIENKHSDSPS
jgi:1-acyl-sn-glycerol-3-phosphate acyltransferase